MLLNPAASRAVRPTPSVPDLTSRAGGSLSFVFLTLPAASRPARNPGAPVLSLDPVRTPEFRRSVRCLVARAPGSRSQSAVSRVRVRGPPAPRGRWPASHQMPRACSRSSWSQNGSTEHSRVPEFREILDSERPRITVSVCSLKGTGPLSACSPVQVATASRGPDTVASSPFCLSFNICAWFHGSPLRTSILNAGDVHL